MMFNITAFSEVLASFISNLNQSSEEEAPNLALITSIALGALGFCAAHAYIVYHRASPTPLDLSDNQLAEIDVSHNPEHRELDLSDNQLAAIDMSHNPELRELDLSINRLAAIDVSQNPELRKVDLSRNRLAAIDISQNPELRELDLSINQLAAIDVSQNPELRKIDFSINRLAAIDVSHNPELRELNLMRNQLAAIDVSQNPELRKLNLGSNELAAIDMSHNPELRELDLRRNRLAAIDVSQNPELRELNLMKNRLAAIDVSQNPELRELDLGSNELAAIDISHNPELRELDLGSNELAAIDISHNSELRELDLGSNELAAIDISHNPELRKVDLSRNRLAAIDVSQNPRLERLDLSHNRFTELPDSILSLPRTCRVNAQNNLFTPEYVSQFLQRLEQHRALHPDQGPTVHISIHDAAPPPAAVSLEDQLAAWMQEFEVNYSQENDSDLWESHPEPGVDLNQYFSPLLNMTPEEKQNLSNYLRRLRGTQDYKDGGLPRKNVILRVERMLQLANTNPAFRGDVLALIVEGLDTCGDRVTLFFNEIEVLWQLNHKKPFPKIFRDLAIRAERCRRVQMHAEEEAKVRGLGDKIQTILYFQVHLKDALQLPISTQNMLYPKVSGVTDEMLIEAREKILAISDDELLATSDYWKNFIKFLHKDPVNEITEYFGELLSDSADYFDLESQEEKSRFLETRPDLEELLARALSKGIAWEYSAVAEFIHRERLAEIASLEYET